MEENPVVNEEVVEEEQDEEEEEVVLTPKEKIIAYIRETPENLNMAILLQLIEDYKNEAEGEDSPK